MLTIFNRRELFTTFNIEEYIRLRGILQQNRIEFSVKIKNHAGSSRGHLGNMGINTDYAYQYVIYVKRNDFENAVYFLNKR